MVVYRLQFLAAAKTEWDKLDGSVQLQFTKVLAKRLEAPRVPKSALAGMVDCYKIKLRTVGYRLVYQVRDESLVLLTVAVGKRDRNAVYNVAMARLPAVVPEKTTKAMQAESHKTATSKTKPKPQTKPKR
jgi:mRNA interferase RelE/StbE